MEYLQYLKIISTSIIFFFVLNLIINGIPSILNVLFCMIFMFFCFKPYYKWNTFNTIIAKAKNKGRKIVLNLIINGIPSILIILGGILCLQ